MTSLAQSFYSLDPAVIVASSNPGLRKQIIQNLLQSRISAAEALGGADALGKLESSECQLLLLDRKLPDLDADELLQIIHGRFPGIDVLLLDDAGIPRCLRNGAAPARTCYSTVGTLGSSVANARRSAGTNHNRTLAGNGRPRTLHA